MRAPGPRRRAETGLRPTGQPTRTGIDAYYPLRIEFRDPFYANVSLQFAVRPGGEGNEGGRAGGQAVMETDTGTDTTARSVAHAHVLARARLCVRARAHAQEMKRAHTQEIERARGRADVHLRSESLGLYRVFRARARAGLLVCVGACARACLWLCV